ncbi:hypothetical protein [Novosphingobium mangrovi (ex Huang et al. 2023)]|uniref:TolC family protein n=1 Tax=Novosphingobium mangrovi (ex Huang et al. 2023) TaxID=2976432 RepID=A0ABT2I9K7_9SPHN|nr:hypothetical protein [Novosphingobium mangrovi (ex Huang et al. 2023)]MCT2401510.1 hypothetical protein [Novosphingobium mangrovi (ex Huang et al. 2023)]
MVLSLCLAGCAQHQALRPPTLGELGLEVPDTRLVDTGGSEGERQGLASSVDWWRAFDDPQLNELVERALAQSPEVRIAALTHPKQLDEHRLAVSADIARSYVELRGAQQRAERIREALGRQDQLIRLAGFRSEAQLVPSLDMVRATAERDRIAAGIPPVEARISERLGHIAALAGDAPGAFGPNLEAVGPVPRGPDRVLDVPPAELQRRRPDLVAAARRFAKSGFLGYRPESARIAYKRAVLSALEEARARNAAFRQAKAREMALEKALESARRAATLAYDDYRQGEAGYAVLEQAQGALLSVEKSLEQARTARACALIDVFEAQGPVPVRDGQPGSRTGDAGAGNE